MCWCGCGDGDGCEGVRCVMRGARCVVCYVLMVIVVVSSFVIVKLPMIRPVRMKQI